MPEKLQAAPGDQQQVLCPGCGRPLDLAAHADVVCNGQIWCRACRCYGPELEANRGLAELQDWAARLCTAFGQEPVTVLENPAARSDWRLYWQDNICLLAEAYHEQRAILLYPPGQRLTTLCHELAHLFTGQDHTPTWAQTFADLTAWVREKLP
ncbi:MAG: hypothetical protein ACUVRZ_07990 [Desulfobacca sp.]|uniref:hypothetical protein n=1 Tax=Desulfobacca sp. TaxID=2067990 RepID=UPI00404AD55C